MESASKFMSPNYFLLLLSGVDERGPAPEVSSWKTKAQMTKQKKKRAQDYCGLVAISDGFALILTHVCARTQSGHCEGGTVRGGMIALGMENALMAD